MGYTHYWKQSRAFTAPEWDLITTSFRKLQQALPRLTATAGSHESDVELQVRVEHALDLSTEIRFNGSPEEYACESMVLKRTPCAPGAWCKTRRHPYDLLVCGLLLVAYNTAPDMLTASSDGDVPDWRPAHDFVSAKLDTRRCWPLGLCYPPKLELGRPPDLRLMALERWL